MSETADFEAAFTSAVERAARELAGEAEGAVNDHPEVDELVDFQEGRLAGDDAERVRRHLESCAECAREVRELETFDQPADAGLRPSPEQTVADWARFQQEVARRETRQETRPEAGEAGEAGGKVLQMPEREHRDAPAEPTAARHRLRNWLPAAAALVIGVIGGYWLAPQRTVPVETPPAPRNLLAVDLVPEGEDRVRDAAAVAEVAVPAGMDALVVRLNLGDQTPFDAYRAEIVDAAGTVVWSRDSLVRQPAGEFVVLIDRAELPGGRYRLSVLGGEDRGETVLATYSFELSYAPQP